MTSSILPAPTMQAPSSMVHDGAEAEGLKARFLQHCGALFDRLIESEGQVCGEHFAEIETFVQTQATQLAAKLCRMRLCADLLANPDREFYCPCCQHRLRILEQQQQRTLATSVGDVVFSRPYGVCERCSFRGAPLDYAMGIPAHGPSITRRELICHAATHERSFEKGQEMLARHDRILLSAEGIRKLAEAEGRHMTQQRDQRVQRCFQTRGRQPQGPRRGVPLLVVTCDGGRVQTCNPNKDERWKEDKIGCVYEAQPRPDPKAACVKEYEGARAVTKTYTATMKPWADFGAMLFTEACARGYLKAEKTLFLSDGLEAIIDLRKTHFPDATHIIDWCHASEHLHSCANAAFGLDTDKAARWGEQTVGWLWDGKLRDVIQAVREQSKRLGPPGKKASDRDPKVVLHRNVGYFTRNEDAMDYPAYRSKGWPIGSGVAEGAVKQFGLRVKGSEQFWNIRGAEEMLQLCALLFSEDKRWDEYWRRRAQPPDDARVWRSAYAPIQRAPIAPADHSRNQP